ncbi:MAG: NTP transferase domain-containing protein [Bacteroidales bacterium]|nr:NTP transferase domain-containing protein [Bacteroidales bacterium]
MSTAAMIFAAGLGTRLYPLTADKPKALVEVEGTPLLAWAIQKVIQVGITRIVVNVHHYGEQIIHYLQTHPFEAEILVSDERDYLRDTGGGFKWAAPLLQGVDHILLYNTDVISSIDLQAMFDFHIRQHALATLAVRNRPTQRYFIFDPRSMLLRGWINKKTLEQKMICPVKKPVELAFSGIHWVKQELLSLISDDRKQSLTDIYLYLAARYSIQGYLHQEDEWADMGKPESLAAFRGCSYQKS